MTATEASGDVTVVIPHFDHGDILPRAVASVLAQPERVRALIVDDGSAPSHLDAAEKLAAASPRVRLERHAKNRGVAAALNTGLSLIETPFCAFLGADDLILPGHCEALLQLLGRHQNAAFACSRVATVDHRGAVTGIRPFTAPAREAAFLDPQAVVAELHASDNWINNVSVIYRNEHLRALGGFDAAQGSFCDALIVRRLAVLHGFCFDPQVRAVWRFGGSSHSAEPASTVAKALDMIARARKSLEASEVAEHFPFYPALHDRRFRLQMARHHMATHGNATSASDLQALVGSGPLESLLLQLIERTIGFAGRSRAITLLLLAARLRPMSLRALFNALQDRRITPTERATLEAEIATLSARATALL